MPLPVASKIVIPMCRSGSPTFKLKVGAMSACAASDGSARTTGDCSLRVLRAGPGATIRGGARSAYRNWLTSDFRFVSLGFRVARTL